MNVALPDPAMDLGLSGGRLGWAADSAAAGPCEGALRRPLGVLRSAHLRTFTVIRISWWSEQPNLYLPGTVSRRLNL